jgi:hypothetical protein
LAALNTAVAHRETFAIAQMLEVPWAASRHEHGADDLLVSRMIRL